MPAAEAPAEAHVAPFGVSRFASRAEVIDVPDSDDDQIYDQYRDAKRRAVGD